MARSVDARQTTKSGERRGPVAVETAPQEVLAAAFEMEAPSNDASFTGERYITGVGGPIQYEHFHRYMVLRDLCAGKDILDIASGDGYGSNFLAATARSVTGVDIDAGTIESASTRYVRPNLKFIQGSATGIPLEDASVDIVVSYETLEHLVEQEVFLSECRRVLRPDGLLVMSTPDTEVFSPPGSEPNPYHLKELTKGEFEELIKSKFRYAVFFGQSPVFGSVISPLDNEKHLVEFLDERSSNNYERGAHIKTPTYLIAIASAKPLEVHLTATSLLNCALSGLPEFVNLAVKASTFEQEVVRLNGEVVHRDQAYQALSQDFADFRAQYHSKSHSERDLQLAETVVSNLQQEVAKHLQHIDDLGGEIERQRAELQRLGIERDEGVATRDVEIQRLKKALADQIADLSAQLSETSALRVSLQGRLDAMENAYRVVIRRDAEELMGHRAENQRLSIRADRLEEELQAVRASEEDARIQLKDRDALEGSLLAMRHELGERALQIETHLANIAVLEATLQHTRAELEGQTKIAWKVEELETAFVDLSAELEEERAGRIADARAHLDALSEAIGQHQVAKEEANQGRLALERQVRDLLLGIEQAPKIDTAKLMELDAELSVARDTAGRAQEALKEEEAQSGWLMGQLAKQGERLAAMDLNLRSLSAELSAQRRANEEIRASTTWIMSRALFRLLNFAPPFLRAFGRRVLLKLAVMMTAFRARNRGGQQLVQPAETPRPATLAASVAPTAKEKTDAHPQTSSADVNIAPATAASGSQLANSNAGSQILIIVALEQGAAPASTMLANLTSLMPAAELIVSMTGGPRLEHGLAIQAPSIRERVSVLDTLIRGAGTPWVVLLTEEIQLTPAAVEAIETVFVTWSDAVAANGLIGSEEFKRADYAAKSTRPVSILQPGVLVFDVDSYILVGGLRHDLEDLADALAEFSRRAQGLGFHVLHNPAISGSFSGTRQASRQLEAVVPRPVVRNGRALKALFCDLVTPTPDRDCGSLNLVWNIRIFQQMGYEVTFLTNWERGYAGRYTDELRAMGVICPLEEDYSQPWEFLAAEGASFDFVMLFRVGCACHLIGAVKQFAPQARVAFNTVDLHFVREEREAELVDSEDMRINAAATRREELNVMRIVDATTVVSTYEEQLLAEILPEARVHCIPIVNPIAGLMGSAAGRSGIMFVGGFAHSPNLDGVLFFIREVWPKVRERLPDQQLHIIGSKPPPDVLSLHSPENGVSIEGFVEDLGPWYKKMRVNIAPLRFGGGIKGKVIASLAVGLPTVGTSIATEGMGLTSGLNVLVADDPAEFAAQIAKLCTDDSFWNDMARNSVRVAREKYSVEAIDSGLKLMLKELGLPH